jgi:hypothetical protein
MSTKTDKKSNKKLLIIAIATLVALAVFGFIFFKILGGAGKKVEVEESIVLDAEYKNTDGKMIELAKNEEDPARFLDELAAEKKNFVVYVSLPICNGDAAKFKQFVLDFQRKEKLSFVYITSDYIKDTFIYDTVKYFPSVIIVKEGKIINYLRYDSDEDVEYYKSYDGFSKWLKANVEY